MAHLGELFHFGNITHIVHLGNSARMLIFLSQPNILLITKAGILLFLLSVLSNFWPIKKQYCGEVWRNIHYLNIIHGIANTVILFTKGVYVEIRGKI